MNELTGGTMEGLGSTGRKPAWRKGEIEKKENAQRRSQAYLIFWLVVASVSVAQGARNALKAGQSQDLHSIDRWLSTWFWQGVNPYYLPVGLTANYPPHALAFLSPLALIPEGHVALIWSALNVALAPSAALLAFSYSKPEARIKDALLPCVLFLSWAGLRVGLGNGQFSLLMLTFGLLAVVVADKRPYSGGALLACALMKPHIGAAFFLWALLTKRWRVVFAALCVMTGGLLLFSARIRQSPFVVTHDFLSVLSYQFGGATFLPGAVELRPLVHLLIPNYAFAEAAHLLMLLAMLAMIWLLSWQSSALTHRQRDVVILQLCSLWGLMSVFHNPYDTILLLPVLAGLWAAAMPPPVLAARRHDNLAFWLVQIALVVELPGIWWKLQLRTDMSRYFWAGQVLSNFDRVLVFCLFVYLLRRVWLYRGPARARIAQNRSLART